MGIFRHWYLAAVLILIIIAVIGITAVLVINSRVKSQAEGNIACVIQGDVAFDGASLVKLTDFEADCILVLGAGIEDEETPTPMLKERLDVGIALYKEGAAPKLLLSGDSSYSGHDEIRVMFRYAVNEGVPEDDILCDRAGVSTYDSMYRASEVFGIRKAIVVTQQYHEYRALYIGEKQGMEVIGVSSDQQKHSGGMYRQIREVLARTKDFFKVRRNLR